MSPRSGHGVSPMDASKKSRSSSNSALVCPSCGREHPPEAEMIQGLLLDAGVPSLVRRSAGFDVPDFLAAGPRDILVPESGVELARGMLLQSGLEARMTGAGRPD